MVAIVISSTTPGVAQQPASPLDSLVARFYAERGGRLAWSDSGHASPQARALLSALAHAGNDGLDPHDYPGAQIDSMLGRSLEPDASSRLDTVLTRAFIQYGWDLSRGRVDPAAVDSLWRAAPPSIDLPSRLERALEAKNVGEALRGLAPPQPGAVALRRALSRYRTIAAHGGWPRVPEGASLQAGAAGARVALLRRRLVAEGYTGATTDSAERFDDALAAAVREFQDRHGLVVDGVVAAETRRALNVSATARARQIAVNLERWRWLPRSLGQRYLVVNSAAFTLDVVDGGQRVLSTRAIVGRRDWPTPIVSSRVTEMIFRPAWHVPRAIAARELLALVQRNPRYLAREGMRVFGDSAAGGQEVDPATIDWSAVTESTFTYRFVQEPGPTNPLGGVRFVFWTPFDVFLHDTPARPLFTERFRMFSHGCVRVERAADLAAYLLPEWSVDSIQAAMATGRERRVRLHASIPVHLVYWTAWSDEDGPVRFRDDTYGWDERLATALAEPRPTPPLIARARSSSCGT